MASNEDSALLWQEISRKKVADCHIFDYWDVLRSNSEGQEGHFTLIDAPNWVTIVVPVQHNGEKCFMMVKQFRHGSETLTMEFVAGTVERGEDPLVAANRELQEETGCQAGRMVLLGAVNPNPAFMGNTSYTYLALDLKKVGEQHLDELESLKVCYIPEKEVRQQIGVGLYNNGIMVQALALYDWYLRKN